VYLKWARFEQKQGELANARAVFENCHEYLGAEAEGICWCLFCVCVCAVFKCRDSF
jgi:hypothetical protein